MGQNTSNTGDGKSRKTTNEELRIMLLDSVDHLIEVAANISLKVKQDEDLKDFVKRENDNLKDKMKDIDTRLSNLTQVLDAEMKSVYKIAVDIKSTAQALTADPDCVSNETILAEVKSIQTSVNAALNTVIGANTQFMTQNTEQAKFNADRWSYAFTVLIKALIAIVALLLGARLTGLMDYLKSL